MRGCLGLTFKQGSNGGMIPLPHGRPRWSYVLWCVVRYGYTDVWFEEEPFERLLVGRLKEFIREEMMMTPTLKHSNGDMVFWRATRWVDWWWEWEQIIKANWWRNAPKGCWQRYLSNWQSGRTACGALDRWNWGDSEEGL